MCTAVRGNLGSTVSANSIFSVLAGASRQCALCAARTAPVSASATIHDRAVSPPGGVGTPGATSTCVPGIPSRSPPTVDMRAGGLGVLGSPGAAAVAALPASTLPPSSAVVMDTARAERAVTVMGTRRTYRADASP